MVFCILLQQLLDLLPIFWIGQDVLDDVGWDTIQHRQQILRKLAAKLLHHLLQITQLLRIKSRGFRRLIFLASDKSLQLPEHLQLLLQV